MPMKKNTQKITVIVPTSLKNKLAKKAKAEGRSVSKQGARLIEQGLRETGNAAA